MIATRLPLLPLLPPLLPLLPLAAAAAALCFDARQMLLSFCMVVRMIFGRWGLEGEADRKSRSCVLLLARATVPER